ncbi:hypothetical protein OXX59_010576, partial [Metschnikowia pulcherrima]
ALEDSLSVMTDEDTVPEDSLLVTTDEDTVPEDSLSVTTDEGQGALKQRSTMESRWSPAKRMT